jgi:seryl-tRNA synthetase
MINLDNKEQIALYKLANEIKNIISDLKELKERAQQVSNNLEEIFIKWKKEKRENVK